MNNTKIEAHGVYKLDCTESLINEAVKLKYGEQNQANTTYRNIVLGELDSVFLLELLVENADERFSANDFKQDGSDQAAYDESYYSVDYKTDYGAEKPDTASFKLLFWFHFLDVEKALQTSYGKVTLPKSQEMPPFYRDLKKYEPVD